VSAEVFVLTADRSAPRLSRLLTVKELADLLQIPSKTIYTWRYKGIGPPAVPMGKYLRFRAEDVAAWLDARADVPRRGGRAKRSQLGARVAGGLD
jgi:excisionase family DNA binding protein